MKSDCENARRHLSQDPTPDEALAHLEACVDCEAWLDAALAETGAASQAADTDSGATVAGLAELEALLAGETGLSARMRSMATPLRARIGVLVAISVACAVIFLVPRADLGVYPPLRLGLELLAHGVALALVGAALLRPAYRSAPPDGAISLAAAAALCLPILIALTNPAHASHAESLRGTGAHLWPQALKCLRFGAVMGLPLLILASLSERSGRASKTNLLCLAAVGTSLGSLALTLHCPIVEPKHLWLGHVTIALPLFLVSGVSLWTTRNRSAPANAPGPGALSP